jgi:hypothetical protein
MNLVSRRNAFARNDVFGSKGINVNISSAAQGCRPNNSNQDFGLASRYGHILLGCLIGTLSAIPGLMSDVLMTQGMTTFDTVVGLELCSILTMVVIVPWVIWAIDAVGEFRRRGWRVLLR